MRELLVHWLPNSAGFFFLGMIFEGAYTRSPLSDRRYRR